MSKESQSTLLIGSITCNIIDRDESISDIFTYHSISSMNSRATNITCNSDYYADGGELHYRLRKQRPDQKFQGRPYFSKLSVRADRNFHRKFWSGTKFFRTKIPVTVHVL